ncbi:hypothetical protein [Nannocystis pusilla]|uniref:Copper resistance protein D domain-containing protein n=1 Tax=Nannocystis pusilla TaxID=889268 RepID=A0ABS7U153_9BACT|nr:hypothetical protein [Nannocystis pusilla]MBZ5714255.1 hypothetical protein [Nannocystis pusilla]
MSTAIAGAVPIAVHVLGGGVWIGAMVFSVFILHPRAERFFTRAAEFEDFIFSVVHGARYKVLAGIAAIVASGVALALAHRATPAPWSWLVAVKVALLLISLALFLHVSFTLWPRRVFAREDELPAVRRRFWWIGVVMIVCNAANMGLGVLARVLRG